MYIIFKRTKKMKKLLPCIIALATCFFTFETKAATGDITGQIIEKETMAPVAYAQVILDNGTTRTIIKANEYGHYSANHLPTGKYQVSVKYDNRVAAMSSIHIKDSYTAGINLVVSSTTSTVEVQETIKDNTTGALQEQKTGYLEQIVSPTQKPAKALLAANFKSMWLLMEISPATLPASEFKA